MAESGVLKSLRVRVRVSPSLLMKKCTRCNIEKDEIEFSFRSVAKQIRQTKCKTCTRQLVKKHYLNNKSKYKEKAKVNNRTYVLRNRTFIAEYLLKHPCVDCKEDDIRVLDFDHLRDKKANIAKLIRNSTSIQTLEQEIDKCEVRCANCHRRKSSKQFGYFKELWSSRQTAKPQSSNLCDSVSSTLT